MVPAGRTWRVATRRLSAVVSFEEEYAVAALGGYAQLGTVTASTLPNGIKFLSTGAAAGCVLAVGVGGIGTGLGPAGAAYAAQKMAFKTAYGKTDLAIQRELELAGTTPHARANRQSLLVACEGLAEDASLMAKTLGDALHRDPYVPWEFAETVKPPAWSLDSALEAAVLSAAYGEGQPASRPAFAAVSSTEVDDVLATAVATAPMTVVGVGLDHAVLLGAATSAFAGLPARSGAYPAMPASFVPGGFAAKLGKETAMAIAYPCADDLMAQVFAAALDGYVLPGLVVLSGKPKAVLVAQAQSLASFEDFTVPILKLKTCELAATGVELAAKLADGFDPDSFLSELDALSPAALKEAAGVMLAQEPALGLVAPPQND